MFFRWLLPLLAGIFLKYENRGEDAPGNDPVKFCDASWNASASRLLGGYLQGIARPTRVLPAHGNVKLLVLLASRRRTMYY